MNLNSGSSNNAEPVLLLTGAIDVHQPNVPFTTLSNSDDRLSQYLYSIRYAIDHYNLVKKIVFCENTKYNHNYSSLIERAKLKGKVLEVLSFQGNYQAIQQKGKGYGEGEAIEYALQNSSLLSNCRLFYKLTGRLVIENLDLIVATSRVGNRFILHPKEIYQRERDHVETYFFKVCPEFYTTKLLGAYKEVDEINNLYIEHLFFERLKGLNIKAFKYPLKIIGNSGTSGKPYLETINAIRLERICCMIGAHHLRKNPFEKFLTALIAFLLNLRKVF